MEVDICAGRPCLLVARFFHRHAHSSKLRIALKAPALVIPYCHFALQPPKAVICLSSSFQENTSQNLAGTRMIKVKFVLRRRCEFGQQFFVIGEDKLLGGWVPEAAIPMQWSEGHVWTLQLDLLSGTCTEFKILLKADEEVIEWQPGPNCKLEVSDSITSLLVFVPWSDEEVGLENETLQSLETNDAERTHNTVEIASSVRNVEDNVQNVDIETDAAVSQDVFDEPKTHERSADSETVKSDAKEFIDKKQQALGLLSGDGGLIGEGMHSNSKPSEEFLSLYPIPDSWYVKESSDIQASHSFTDPSPNLLEVKATGRVLTSATELSVNEEETAGEKAFLPNESNDLIAKAKSSEADNEDICKENDQQHSGEDELADTIAPLNVGSILSTAKPKENQKGSAQKAQHGRTGAFAEPKEESIVAEPKEESIVNPAVLDNEEPTADGQVMDREDPIEMSTETKLNATVAETNVNATVATPAENELPGSELSSIQSDSSESVETKSAKDKKWGRKRWSKLWNAIVKGRIE